MHATSDMTNPTTTWRASLERKSLWAVVIALLILIALLSTALKESVNPASVDLTQSSQIVPSRDDEIVGEIVRLGGRFTFTPSDLSDPYRELREIDLSDTKTEARDLAFLANLTHQITIDLSGTKINDADLKTLGELPSVYSVKFGDCDVSAEAARRLLEESKDLVYLSRKPRGLRFFPKGLIEPVPNNEFLTNWISEDLYVMDEPSLWAKALSGASETSYRLYWAGLSHSALVIRISATSKGGVVESRRLGKKSAYRGGMTEIEKRVEIVPDDFQAFENRFELSDVANMQPYNWTRGVTDGAMYLFEILKDGRYHAVMSNTNWEPDEHYLRILKQARAMIELSELEILPEWDAHLERRNQEKSAGK